MKYLAIIFSLITFNTFGQSYDPKVEIFNFTEELPKCEGGIEKINEIFNSKYSTDNQEVSNINLLIILIDYKGLVRITKSEPAIDSTLTDSINSLLNSIKWRAAHQRQQATNFQATLKISTKKKKFIISNIVPEALRDGSYSSQYVPELLIEKL